jgi:hypothetical protein
VTRGILIVLVLLFATSVSGLAQQPNAAEAVFDKWRREAPADDVSRLRFALAAVARRTGDQVAEVDLWVVGRPPEAAIDVQPLYFEKLPNGGYGDRREWAGEVTKTRIGNSGDRSGPGENVGLKIILPVRPNANALEIKWVGYDGGKILDSTITTILLGDEPSGCLTRITGD